MYMKNLIDSMHRTIGPDGNGKPEKELTREQRESLLESVDLSKVENYKFNFPLIECCPKLKMVLGDPEHNVKDGILAMMVSLNPHEPQTKEDLESQEWNYGPALNKKALDWNKIERYGYVDVYLKLRHYLVGTQIEVATENPKPWQKKSYKKFTAISDVPSVFGMDPLDMEGIRQIEKDATESEGGVLAKLKGTLIKEGAASEDTELVLKSYNARICIELEKEIPEEIKKQEKENPFKRPQELEFEYEGHSFKITGTSIDNEDGGYGEALYKDNPFSIKRGGAHTKCTIDGVDTGSKDLYYVLKWLHKDLIKRSSLF